MRRPKLHRFLLLIAVVKFKVNSRMPLGGKCSTQSVEAPVKSGTTINLTQRVCGNCHTSTSSGDIRLKVRHSTEAIHPDRDFRS